MTKTKINQESKGLNAPIVRCCALSKDWFYREYGFMLKGHYQTDCLSLDLVFSNIIGINERFTNYEGSNDTIQDAFAMDFMDMGKRSRIKCKDIFTLLKIAKDEAIELEYYEISNNITVILNEFIKSIKNRHNEYMNYLRKHCT